MLTSVVARNIQIIHGKTAQYKTAQGKTGKVFHNGTILDRFQF